MLKKILLLAALALFAAIPAFADQDCATGHFVGTYTRATAAVDVLGNGDLHAAVFQLTLNADGSATQTWTGLQDYQISTGSGSVNVGAWKCRDNGNLIVSLLSATYVPLDANPSLGLKDDLGLQSHVRATMIFSITDNNTITRIKYRARTYTPDADPTDPNGGTLGNLSTTQAVYKRFEASAADITAP
ncbi:MAG: hypothetical protein ABJA02_13080 [Acidobacteriota bacterium]